MTNTITVAGFTKHPTVGSIVPGTLFRYVGGSRENVYIKGSIEWVGPDKECLYITLLKDGRMFRAKSGDTGIEIIKHIQVTSEDR